MIADNRPWCWLAAIAAGSALLSPATSAVAQAQAAAIQTVQAAPSTPRPARRAAAPAVAACRYEPLGTATVTAIRDGRSFVLDDGREVRLDGIEVPLLGADLSPEQAAAGRAAKAALEELVLGRSVELRPREAAPDRYGRIVAHVHVLTDGRSQSVAEELLARGHARVAADAGDGACAAALLQRERKAREAKLGLWGDPYYPLRTAGDLAGLLAERGRFSVVEGMILSVRESGGFIYMNFGRRWSQALTVTIAKRREAIFTAAGLDPKRLGNRRVRVRGWIEERNGPRIEATRPEQIEIAERQ